MKVGVVVEGSPAVAKSVKVGSVLRKVNGRSVEGMDAAAVKQLIASLGRPLRLSLKRV